MVDVNFSSFFTHILAHELMHGLGPHQITVSGRDTTPRAELKELFSAIEEAKADVTGLFALQYMMDHASEMKLGSILPSDEAAQRQLYTTYLASAFRSLRFGLNDAHGKGMHFTLRDINGRVILKTTVGDRWYFRDFVDSPDERFRKIVKRFIEAELAVRADLAK